MAKALRQTVLSGDFEAKTRELVAVTKTCSVPQVLLLRRATLDGGGRKWASTNQIKVIFNVILTARLQAMGLAGLREAQSVDFETLLPPSSSDNADESREQDRDVLHNAVAQVMATLIQAGDASETTEMDVRDHAAASGMARAAANADRGLRPAAAGPGPASRPAGPTDRDLLAAADVDLAAVAAAVEKRPAPQRPAAERAPPPARPRPVDDDGDDDSDADANESKGGLPVLGDGGFEVLFDDTICIHIRTILSFLHVKNPGPGKSPSGMPFLICPAFTDIFESVVRAYVLPTMHTTRSFKRISESRNWAEVGGRGVVEIIRGKDTHNPIIHLWNERWDELKVKPEAGPKKTAAKKTPPKETKKSGLFGLFGGSKAAEAKKKTEAKTSGTDDAHKLWAKLAKDAEKHDYIAPTIDDFIILQKIISYSPAMFHKAIDELYHYYLQEFEPMERSEQGREGSLRDGLNKWIGKLPTSIGEFFLVKGYYEWPKVDIAFVKRFSTGYGLTPAERRRAIPYVMSFLTRQTGEE